MASPFGTTMCSSLTLGRASTPLTCRVRERRSSYKKSPTRTASASPPPVGGYSGNPYLQSNAIALSGNYAYLTIGATTGGLVIVDISNPSAPQRVSEYDTYYPAQGIKIYDVYAYIVGSNIDVLVLEI